LTGTTLNSGVVSSSLTSVGNISSGTWGGTTITPSHGGTGLTTLTANSVLLGEGTGSLGSASIGTAGRILTDQGASTDPKFVVMSGGSSMTSSGVMTTLVNANLTGPIISSGNATSIAGPLPFRQRVTSNVGATSGVSVSDLSVTLVSGQKYTGRYVIYCNQSIAIDGIFFSLAASGASFTNFKATILAYNSSGSVATSTFQTTSVSTTFFIGTVTGEVMMIVELALVVNAGGSLVLQISNVSGLGTATVELGSSLSLDLSNN
jgi:hypothetical protein